MRTSLQKAQRDLSKDLSHPASAGEFSLYFHLPFCQKKCPYCNFFVLMPTEQKMKKLRDALLAEWQQRKRLTKDRQLRSIYFGGGTPSLFPLSYFKELLETLQPDNSVEITVEVNPEHATFALFSSLRSLGVNRISLGVQSLRESALALLGRNHTAATVKRGVKAALDAGFDNISLDLMYELPDQTPQQWQEALTEIFRWPIQHLSFYNLTIEPKTPFFRDRKELLKRSPSSSESALMFDMMETESEGQNWERYEISAMARPGFESQHNTGYWRGRSYLGLGPSAHSFWDGKRWENSQNWKVYIAAALGNPDRAIKEDILGKKERQRELFLIHLRLTQGIDLVAFQLRWGLPHSYCRLMSFVKRGLMQIEGNLISLTSTGRRYYNTIAVELI